MGLAIAVLDETGTQIDVVLDPTNLLHAILPDPSNDEFCCVRFVDWYGDTVFNRYQTPVVRAELLRLRSADRTREEMAILDRIVALTQLCESEPHRYLKFVGD